MDKNVDISNSKMLAKNIYLEEKNLLFYQLEMTMAFKVSKMYDAFMICSII